MNHRYILTGLLLVISLIMMQCKSKQEKDIPKVTESINGYESMLEYGEHLVTISGCHDCHTPRKMGPNGPEMDFSLALSGHPANLPIPDIDRAEFEKKGWVVIGSPTAWIGPWGVSFASNITSDDTGIGVWSEEQFFKALRKGKYKGLEGSRQLLPPMPWEMFKNMTDTEIKAIYAYLKSTKPINNIVPAPLPPASSME